GMKIIHIAGTSGKGTVTNLIHQIFWKAGYKTGVHVSPYAAIPLEKIQINGKFISPKEFSDVIDEAKPFLEKCLTTFDAPSFFEALILIVLLYFKKKRCDYVVLETGLGGRYDGTNAVGKTILQIITNIGLDHTQILGNTVEKIAFEKAGIIRPHGHLITTATQPSVLKVFEKICKEKKSTLEVISSDNPNEALAITVAKHFKIKNAAINAGLRTAKLPCRFEIVKKNPAIIIDGAHNPDKLKYCAVQLAQYLKKQQTKIHLVFALTNQKSIKDCLSPFKHFNVIIYPTRFLDATRKVTWPNNIATAAKQLGIKCQKFFLDPQDALQKALAFATKSDIILITGSFYLCSELREHWISEDYMIKNKTLFKKF
ncbi:MAG: Mur ligase family protein, partial [Candidatus Falkowbacteria bacterium]